MTKEKKPVAAGDLNAEEIRRKVIEFGNQARAAAEIGMLLRDQFGVPNVFKATGKSVKEILAQEKLLPEIPEDLMSLIRRSVTQQRHMKENKKDQTAKRGYTLTVSKIRRLAVYYQREGLLPASWKYSPETAALLVK
ncbi:MAG: 30S ribosomal protein S15 [Candidatus Diapherotrites archaeon]|nr:30S ribosomal protein S15 [Candidatus Diapherotrites archaeon]